MTSRVDRGPSFTAQVIAELAPHLPPLRCCRSALLDGMRKAGAEGVAGDLLTARLVAARVALAALHADGRAAHVERVRTARRMRYRVTVVGDEPARLPGRGASAGGNGVFRREGRRSWPASAIAATAGPLSGLCCARSLLRGAVLSAGLIARPEAAPHLEVLCRNDAAAAEFVATFARLGVVAQSGHRRGRPIVTVRSVEAVGAALSVIGAQSGRLRFEGGRVLREMRGGVNRAINGETANLRRTVHAGVRQADAIRRRRVDRSWWDALPPALREAAQLRDRHPEDSLERLATRAGCSRSAMADRLRRLLAEA